MVLTMMRRPPQRSFLQSAATEASDEELHHPAGFVGAMREIAMVAGRDAEHADEVKDAAQDESGGIDAGEQHGETSKVQTDKRHALQPVRKQRGNELRWPLAQEGRWADRGREDCTNKTLLNKMSDLETARISAAPS